MKIKSLIALSSVAFMWACGEDSVVNASKESKETSVITLKVVDSKSGQEKLNPAKIYSGAQLQLLLYLKAALTTEPGALPAGRGAPGKGDTAHERKG